MVSLDCLARSIVANHKVIAAPGLKVGDNEQYSVNRKEDGELRLVLCGQEGGGGESYGWREALTVRGRGK